MELKVLNEENTPKNCTRRVLIYHDECFDWVRDMWDHAFLLWSNNSRYKGDTEDSPFEAVLDEDGCDTGRMKKRDGLIVIPVDIYEHSGRVWFLRGEAPAGCNCPWDSTCYHNSAPFYLYIDKERWENWCGKCEWKFEDGEPSKELKEAAYKIARGEIEDMNLCESGSMYRYSLEEKDEKGEWEETEGCGGYLTDEPARDIDFPIGVPVVSNCGWLVGDHFEQEIYVLKDSKSGKFLGISDEFVDCVNDATFWATKEYAERECKNLSKDHESLVVCDMTEQIWNQYPECIVQKKKNG